MVRVKLTSSRESQPTSMGSGSTSSDQTAMSLFIDPTSLPCVDDLEPGQRVWIYYKWGPMLSGTTEVKITESPVMLSIGEYVGRDEYNAIVSEDDGRRNYIPVETIRLPGWIMVMS